VFSQSQSLRLQRIHANDISTSWSLTDKYRHTGVLSKQPLLCLASSDLVPQCFQASRPLGDWGALMSKLIRLVILYVPSWRLFR
jgi:hypothetical protein